MYWNLATTEQMSFIDYDHSIEKDDTQKTNECLVTDNQKLEKCQKYVNKSPITFPISYFYAEITA